MSVLGPILAETGINFYVENGHVGNSEDRLPSRSQRRPLHDFRI